MCANLHSGNVYILEKPRIYEACPKEFSQKENLKKRCLTHVGEKLHFSETCNKDFSLMEHLKIHHLTHTDKKPGVF